VFNRKKFVKPHVTDDSDGCACRICDLDSNQERTAARGHRIWRPKTNFGVALVSSRVASAYYMPMEQPAEQDPRVYLAAERTFLAWLRTGLGLIGVGFAVSRFGLFLRQFSSESHLAAPATGLSVWSGVALVCLGVVVNVGAVVRHFRLVGELRSGTWKAGVSTSAVALGLLLAAVGLGMAIYLVRVD
jgi:putative membrane protein